MKFKAEIIHKTENLIIKKQSHRTEYVTSASWVHHLNPISK